jgi:hypothetical protein
MAFGEHCSAHVPTLQSVHRFDPIRIPMNGGPLVFAPCPSLMPGLISLSVEGRVVFADTSCLAVVAFVFNLKGMASPGLLSSSLGDSI